MSNCPNCSNNFDGNFCPNCGQKKLTYPYTLKLLLLSVIDAFDFNRGFLFTLYKLLTSPGKLLKGYLAGKTKPYNNPVKFLFTLVAFISIVALLGSDEEIGLLLFLPVISIFFIYTVAFNFVVYKSRFNIVENFISSLYLTSALVFIVAIITISFFILERVQVMEYNDTLAGSIALGLMSVYVLFFYVQIVVKKNLVTYIKPILYFIGIVSFFFLFKLSKDVIESVT
jgi:hypothetical protein